MHDFLTTLPKSIPIDRSPASLLRHSQGDGGARDRPCAIARPTTSAQVQALLSWANDTGCGLVPISSSDARAGGGAEGSPVVIDMSGMKRVIHVDPQDSIAVIEPGLTFSGFDAALKPYGLRSFKPLLPRRGKSVLASYLDREPITSPHDHWDSEDPLGGSQLVFGNGEAFRTGTAAVRGTLGEQLEKGGRQMMAMGPASTDFMRVIQGSQGTLAVLTWASVFCEPVPALERAFFVGSDDIGPLVELAYKILWRRTGGQLFLVNSTQLGMIGAREAKDCVALSAGLPRWILYVNLTCPDYMPDERMAYMLADLNADAAALGLQVSERIGGYAAAAIGAQQDDLPQQHYKDRLRGAHQSLFFLTQMDQAPRFLDMLDALQAEHLDMAQPAGVYIQPRIQGVSAHFELVFPFDPQVDGVARRVADFTALAARRMADAGAFFSRPHGDWSAIAFEKDAGIKPYLAAVKDMMDPKGILCPGRLCF